MKVPISLFIIYFFLSVSCEAKSLGAHVHGDVYLDVATDKNQLLVMLRTPSDSFLGFEYQASTNKEKATYDRVKSEWNKNILNYIGKLALKDCKVESSKWEQVFSSKVHSNITAESYIKCKKPVKGRVLHVSLKKSYSRIRSIKLQLLRDDGTSVKETYVDDVFKINL